MKVGILNAYHFDVTSDYQLAYSTLFVNFVRDVFSDHSEIDTQIHEYKVAQGLFPQSVAECDIWFITGSPKSVYEDIPWIHQLKKFTQDLHRNQRKIIGICFGHQMIAYSLGGDVTKSEKGWGVGIRNFNIFQQKPWMAAHPSSLSLLFSHQDQVNKLADGAELLAGDDFCPNQMCQIGETILTLQGHPEFSVEFAQERLNSRRNLMAKTTFEVATESYKNKNDYKIMINWIRSFLKITKKT